MRNEEWLVIVSIISLIGIVGLIFLTESLIPSAILAIISQTVITILEDE